MTFDPVVPEKAVWKAPKAMRPLRHVRAVMNAPSFASLPAGLRNELTDASAALRRLKPVAPEAVETAPDDCFRALRHALSSHYVALHASSNSLGRSRLEADALAVFEAGPDRLLTSSPLGFRDQLRALNRTLTDGKDDWRDGFVKLSDDRAGNQIYFPPVSAVPGQIERLRSFIAAKDAAPPLFTAAVAYALLLNCHPFTDGNGRTARVLFNHLLHRGGMPAEVYLALHEIARRSQGGYEIALRIAELHGDWEPFLRWLLDAIRCCRDLAATDSPRFLSALGRVRHLRLWLAAAGSQSPARTLATRPDLAACRLL
jgi:hypothetical protein